MKQLLSNFNGDPNVGLYGFCNDKHLLLSKRLDENKIKLAEEATGLKASLTTMLGIDLIGIFVAGNSNGIIVSDEAYEEEIDFLRNLGIKVAVIKSKNTAFGNLIVANDNGAFVSELLRDHAKEIEETLGVPVEIGTIAGLEIVGSVAVATNQGCLVHPNTSEEEAQRLEQLLKVKVDVGTVNFGSPFVKSGILVNSNGALIGDQTSGPEVTRILETLYE